MWDLTYDQQSLQEGGPLQVARCTSIINPGTPQAKYVINVKQIAKFVVVSSVRYGIRYKNDFVAYLVAHYI